MVTSLLTAAQRPRIAIVGGGPGGLTLAAVLERHGWTASVFDSDASADARDQGGTLDLHPNEGQLALVKAGLLDAFMAVARHDDQGERVLDFATAAVLREDIPEPGTGQRPEIDRVVLRRLLLDAVAPGTVRWGARVREVVGHLEGGYDLRLDDGLAGPFDLVVGADGAWSRVRRALTPIVPAYTGVTFVEFRLSEVDHRHPELAGMVGHGTMFALGEGKGVIAQRNGGATIRTYAAFHRKLSEGERIGIPAAIDKAEVLAHFEGWAAPLRALIAAADRPAAVRPIMALPPSLDWPARVGLTVIGDAAHVMPPLGTGVNLAMLDAAELGEALVASCDWRAAVAAFEHAMFVRARQTSQECQRGFSDMFGGDGAQSVLDHIAGQTSGHPEASVP